MVAAAKQLMPGRSGLKVGLIGLATSTGTLFDQLATGAIQKEGWSVVAKAPLSLDGTNTGPPAAQIASAKPDIVFGAIASTSEQPFLQQLRQNGYTGPIVVYSSGVVSSIFQALNDPNLYGLLAYNYPTESNAAVSLFTQRAQAAGVNPGAQLTPNGYAGGLMLVAALQKCGPSCTGTGLAQAYESLTGFDGSGFFAGPLKISSTNHDAFTVARVVHWENGTMKSVGTVNGTQG